MSNQLSTKLYNEAYTAAYNGCSQLGEGGAEESVLQTISLEQFLNPVVQRAIKDAKTRVNQMRDFK